MEEYREVKCKSCSKVDPGRIDVQRFITKLDDFFSTNDLKGAGEYLKYWETEARAIGDTRGLLAVLNEEIGYYRRTNEAEPAIRAVFEAKELLDTNKLSENASGAVIYINMATTLSAFGRSEEGLPLYDSAEKIYTERGLESAYEFAALLNNRATALSKLKRYDEAEDCINRAVEILKAEGKHDGEIAVSLVNLAHVIFDRDGTAYEWVEETLDLAWEYINSPRQPHDANYAFILSKCAPSLRYFKREIEAQALEEVAAEIYGEKR